MPKRISPRGLTELDVNEIVIGKVLLGKLPSKALPPPECFVYPYGNLVAKWKDSRKPVTREDLAEAVGWTAISAAIKAAETVGGGDINWLTLLERKHEDALIAVKLEKALKGIQEGRGFDRKDLSDILLRHDIRESAFTRLADVAHSNTPFSPTGYPPIDDHMSGFPPDDLVIVAGAPGSGKTSLAITIALAEVQAKKGIAAFFSLEMRKLEFARRCREIAHLPKRLENNLIIADRVRSISEVAEEVTKEMWRRKQNKLQPVSLVLVDFAEVFFVMSDDEGEVAAARIYGTFHYLAQDLGVPVLLIAGLNRGYLGGLPRPCHIRNTGMAEYFGWEIFTVYNPCTDMSPPRIDKYGRRIDPELKSLPGIAYICCWKARGGFRKHPKDSPGAIAIPWDGESSWGHKALQWLKLH